MVQAMLWMTVVAMVQFLCSSLRIRDCNLTTGTAPEKFRYEKPSNTRGFALCQVG
jgi:hypothetical protein